MIELIESNGGKVFPTVEKVCTLTLLTVSGLHSNLTHHRCWVVLMNLVHSRVASTELSDSFGSISPVSHITSFLRVL